MLIKYRAPSRDSRIFRIQFFPCKASALRIEKASLRPKGSFMSVRFRVFFLPSVPYVKRISSLLIFRIIYASLIESALSLTPNRRFWPKKNAPRSAAQRRSRTGRSHATNANLKRGHDTRRTPRSTYKYRVLCVQYLMFSC